MKEFFEKITQSAKDISKGVAGQTKTTVTQGKVEIDLLQAKKELNKLYAQLGEKVYENRLHPQANPKIEVLYDQIEEKEAEVRDLERSAIAIRKEQKNTFESVKRNVKRTWDGEGQESRTPEADDEGYLQMKFCPECNIGNHPDAEYCIACGHKQE